MFLRNRFFYFPTSTSGCDEPLEPVDFDNCDPEINFSEIKRIFIAKGNAQPLTDWTDQDEWLTRLSDSQTAGDDYIRTLVVIADKPAPTDVVKQISNKRQYNLTKNHVINFTIDETNQTNYAFVQGLAKSGQVKIWYETHGGKMYGGNGGIVAYVTAAPVLNRGVEEIETFNGTFAWDNQEIEDRIESPIFNIVSPGTETVFNNILTFVDDVTDTSQGVTATIGGAQNAIIQFQFNTINPQLGTPHSMSITLNAIEVAVVDYPSDYDGAAFRYIDAAGDGHIGVFTNGAQNF